MKVQCLESDEISMLPSSVIELILTLMPIRDAGRTSVLSRKWRYNWAKIPKLVFDDEFMKDRIKFVFDDTREKLFYAIYQILMLHHGPILEFSFNIWGEGCFEIDQIILYLSRNNNLKKFTLFAYNYKLPSSFYSLQHLTHLNLEFCEFHPPSTFNGFNMLTSLTLDTVNITEKMLLGLISCCPQLKSFTWSLVDDITDEITDEIIEREEEFSFGQLFKYLPLIEHLTLNFYSFQWSEAVRVPHQLPTSLTHLKYLNLCEIWLMREHEFSFTLLLIRSSPNLEKVRIRIHDNQEVLLEDFTGFFELQDYSDVWLDRLTEFEIEGFNNAIPELELLKIILIKSPVLKKVVLKNVLLIFPGALKSDEEMRISRSLLRLPRASPVVEIIVEKEVI